MPIIKRKSSKGNATFVHFRGLPEEVKKINANEIARIFSETGNPLKNPEKFRQDLLTAITDVHQQNRKTVNFWVDLKSGKINLQIVRGSKGKIVIRQHPFTHSITLNRTGLIKFETLKKILHEGFKSNMMHANVYIRGERKATGIGLRENNPEHITNNDRFTLEIMGKATTNENQQDVANLQRATPEQILGITIEIDPGSNQERIKRKVKFYKKELKGWNLHFIRKN